MIFLFAGFLLALIGYLIRYRRVYWLIKGYAMMPQEEKDTLNLDELASFTGKLHFVLALLFLILGAWTLASLPGATAFSTAVLVIAVISALAARKYIQRSPRFRR